MNSQEILAKYKNQEEIKNIKLDEIITLIKESKIHELSYYQLCTAKVDKHDILDTNLSDKIIKDEELSKKLFVMNIKLTFSDILADELLAKNPAYMQMFSSKMQIKYKDFILKHNGVGFNYLCDELKYDFEFLKEHIKNIKQTFDDKRRQDNYFNQALKVFKANQNYNDLLLECFTSNNIEIYEYNKKRFKSKEIFTLKDILKDPFKYKKIILNKNNELKKTYYDLVLNEFSSLNDDEFKELLTNFITKPTPMKNLFKNFAYLKRVMQLKDISNLIISFFKNNELYLELPSEQAQELVNINENIKDIIKNYQERSKNEKIIISFSNDTKSLIIKDSLEIDELINLAYTKELKEDILYSDLNNKQNISNLIINDSLNTATLIRYDDTSKTTKKLIYSFKKAVI